MSGTVLTLNAGSSSIKFSLYPADAQLVRGSVICDGEVEGIGNVGHFFAKDASGASLADLRLPDATNHATGLETILKWFEKQYADRKLVAAGHRVVHGGDTYTSPVRIDAAVTNGLRKLIPLAPLHQPHNLAAIEALSKLYPQLVQIACFDTAFHSTMAAIATEFALPRSLTGEGVRRYGFHGLSYEYIAGMLPHVLGPEAAEGRVVVAHLGNGASMCAMRRRRSIATTMGFTALDGLMMGSRSGAIDPGVLLYLLQQKHMSAEAVGDLLYNRSGLLGVSEISSDMRELLDSDDPRARAAIDLYVYRIVRELGSLAAALGGLDALIFTAGIGEHAVEIRKRVLLGAKWLGIDLDEKANTEGGPCISQSHVSAWVVPTDEDLVIARHTIELI